MTRVLVAERDETIAGLLQAALCRMLDCDATVAGDVESAAAALKSQVFDLVLLDVGMYSDGLQTLRRIRGPNANCEVIALTTGPIAAPLLKTLAEADVFAVITKPFDLGQLETVVLESLRADRHAKPNRPLVYRKSGADPTVE